MNIADSQLLDWPLIRARESARARRNFRTALLFIGPAASLVVTVLLLPVAFDIYISFTKWKKFSGLTEFAGFANYAQLSSSLYFGEALYNTLLWVVASIIFPVGIGLLFAILLHNVRFENTLKNILFFPRILAPTTIGVIWYYVYAPDGILNRFLGVAMGQKIDVGWLYQENTVTLAIIATFVWQTVGLAMVLILLGIRAIPVDPLEAAQIDGASKFQIFQYMTLPLLMPTLVVVLTLSVLAGFTAFDLLWVMGTGYPGQRTLSLAVYMYFESFQKGSWAFGAAIAVVIGLVVLCVTWLQTLLQHRADRIIR